MRKAHPNLYEVIELFQAVTEVTIEKLSFGGQPKQKRRRVIQHEERISWLKEELAKGDRTLESYVAALQHCVVSL